MNYTPKFKEMIGTTMPKVMQLVNSKPPHQQEAMLTALFNHSMTNGW